MQENYAIVYHDSGEKETIAVGDKGVTSVFCDRTTPNVLVVVTDKSIVKYAGIPFIVYSKRTSKDIEA